MMTLGRRRSPVTVRDRVRRRHAPDRWWLKGDHPDGLRHLEPVPPGGSGGNTAHYYPFVVNLLWPLVDLLGATDAGRTGVFTIERRGALFDLLPRLFPDRVRIVGGEEARTLEALPLTGFNPKRVRVTRRDARSFASSILEAVDVKRSVPGGPSRVVMIRRGSPDPDLAAQGRRSGTARRHIVNHDELASIADELSAIRVDHVVLEEMAFNDQVELFANTAVVVGQHGAGLVNALWMSPGTILELGQPRYYAYQRVADLVGHRYLWMPMPGPIAAADPSQFRRVLAKALRNVEVRA